jgi:hypothetical protein
MQDFANAVHEYGRRHWNTEELLFEDIVSSHINLETQIEETNCTILYISKIVRKLVIPSLPWSIIFKPID